MESLPADGDTRPAPSDTGIRLVLEATRRMNEECARMHETFRKSGYDEGFAQGVRAGTAQGVEEGRLQAEKKVRETYRDMLGELRCLIRDVETRKQEILSEYIEGISGLAIDIARKIVQKELASDDTVLRSLIQSAARSYRNQEWLKICVSKRNVELLMQDESFGSWMKEISGDVRLVPLMDMADDDCRIELPDRVVFAGVETQLQRIREALAI